MSLFLYKKYFFWYFEVKCIYGWLSAILFVDCRVFTLKPTACSQYQCKWLRRCLSLTFNLILPMVR